MEQQEDQSRQVGNLGGGASFYSGNIGRTQSGRPKEYFVKIRPSFQSRKAECQAKRARRKEVLLGWLKYYRTVIIIVFSLAILVAILIVILVVNLGDIE